MELTIKDKSVYITTVFTLEDADGGQYYVRFVDGHGYEVESPRDVLEPSDPMYDELITICENNF